MLKVRKSSIALLMMAMIVIFPPYFGVEISSSLPVMSVSRIIILLFVMNSMLKKSFFKKNLYFFNLGNLGIVWTIYIVLHLIIVIVSGDIVSAFKDLFSIILDELILIMVVVNYVDTSEKAERLLNVFIALAAIVAFGGILEGLVGYNFWDNFYTISRQITSATDTRLGVSRVTFSFQHSIYFGMFLNLTLPLIFYKIKKDGGLFYKLALIANIGCTFMTVSRGAIAVSIFLVAINFLDQRHEQRKKFTSLILIGIIGVSVIFAVSPEFAELVDNSIKAVLNELGFNYELSNFGSNSNGMESRLYQFDLYGEHLRNNWLTGLGSSASSIYVSVDNGYLGWMISGGILKTIGKFLLVFTELFILLRYKKSDDLCKAVLYSLVGYLLSLIGAPENITLNALNFIFILFVCNFMYGNTCNKQ